MAQGYRTLSEEVGVGQERVRLEELQPEKISLRLGSATTAIQCLDQATVEQGATEDRTKFHLRAPGPAHEQARPSPPGDPNLVERNPP